MSADPHDIANNDNHLQCNVINQSFGSQCSNVFNCSHDKIIQKKKKSKKMMKQITNGSHFPRSGFRLVFNVRIYADCKLEFHKKIRGTGRRRKW